MSALTPSAPQRPAWAPTEPTPRPMSCVVLTASDSRGPAEDSSGDLIVSRLTGAGHELLGREIVREDFDELCARLDAHLNSPAEVILITGGTGITLRDLTPDVIARRSSKEIPGFGELFRWLSYADIGSSTIQSRACAHLCGETLVFALPGSTGAVRLAMDEIIIPQLDVRHKPCNFAQLMPRIKGGAP